MAPSLGQNMVYSLTSALIGQNMSVCYWAKYECMLMHPPAGELQAPWSPNTTSVITAIPDVILIPVQ